MKEKLLTERLEEKIEEIRNSLPAHSIPAALLIDLEDLEGRLENLQAGSIKDSDASA